MWVYFPDYTDPTQAMDKTGSYIWGKKAKRRGKITELQNMNAVKFTVTVSKTINEICNFIGI